MTGLVIKLKPNEKLLINGALIQNGDCNAKLRIRSKNVSVLRARDAITQDQATTPLKKIYYIAQLAIVGEAVHEEASKQIQAGLLNLREIFRGDGLVHLEAASEAASSMKFFAVMRSVRRLFPLESILLSQRTDGA